MTLHNIRTMIRIHSARRGYTDADVVIVQHPFNIGAIMIAPCDLQVRFFLDANRPVGVRFDYFDTAQDLAEVLFHAALPAPRKSLWGRIRDVFA